MNRFLVQSRNSCLLSRALQDFINNKRHSSLLSRALQDINHTKVKSIPVFSSGNMRTSPQKLNHLARLIRGMTINEAKHQMSFVLKKRAKNILQMLLRIEKCLSHNYGLNTSDFIVKQSWVGKGQYLKRLRMMGRGRTGRMTRPSSHLKIMLGKRDNVDWEMVNLKKQFKKHSLFLQLNEKRPVLPLNPVWSRKQYKYLYSPKWNTPNAALKKL